jgi:hypothetical protein
MKRSVARRSSVYVGALSLSVVFGCSSARSSPSPSTPAAIPDPVVVPASQATTSAIKVTKWGIDTFDPLNATYKGYDSSGTAIFAIKTVGSSDGAGGVDDTITFSPSSGGAGAVMHYVLTSTTFTLATNTFTGNDLASAVLQAMKADFTANASGPSAPVGLTQSETVHPEDVSLVAEAGSCLLNSSCVYQSIGAAGTVAGTLLECGGVALELGVSVNCVLLTLGGCIPPAAAVSAVTLGTCVVAASAMVAAQDSAKQTCGGCL